jgi:hypothetical protein
MDMGLESAQLVEVGAAIQRDLNIELYPTLFFEYTNVQELTDYFYKEHRQKLAQLLDRAPAAGGTSAARLENSAGPAQRSNELSADRGMSR